ncbi:sensor histidine kinase [Pseudofulvibacter geojedonensis]|uniref:histidine kinase n=1 Tax=Pseudofulvibacter geojedonensis TaxID=1123758 RepID=A0ABW3I3B2_9FLAO
MTNKIKKTYRFALYSSMYITLFLTLFIGVFLYQTGKFDFWLVLMFLLVCYGFCFVVIQFRVERFIYKRVKKIYDDVSLLESTSFKKEAITTDMATLTKEVEKFAKDKKLEIETLRIRETYRKEFIGNISHELKTPLFTVQGYILTLLDGAGADEKIREKYLNRASKGVDRLIYIVNDLDMITKLEVGDLNLNYTSFNIIEVVQNVFDLFEMKASKKNVALVLDREYDKEVLVYADKERIQQVITNLVVNSIKYGQENGTTEISVEPLIKNKVIVRVTDNGEGISEEHLPRLFERFYRVDKSGSRQEGGSGLGLAIVKHIVEAHDERIYVESEVGVGSEFSFTLERTSSSFTEE